MLNVNEIKVKMDEEHVRHTAFLLRDVRGKNEADVFIYKPTLQFTVMNVGEKHHLGFETHLNYYDKEDNFIGFERCHYHGLFKPGSEVATSLDVDVPDKMVSAELVILVDRPFDLELEPIKKPTIFWVFDLLTNSYLLWGSIIVLIFLNLR